MLNLKTTARAFSRISDNVTHNNPDYYGAEYDMPEDSGTSNTCVLAPNGDAVAITSTINQV